MLHREGGIHGDHRGLHLGGGDLAVSALVHQLHQRRQVCLRALNLQALEAAGELRLAQDLVVVVIEGVESVAHLLRRNAQLALQVLCGVFRAWRQIGEPWRGGWWARRLS